MRGKGDWANMDPSTSRIPQPETQLPPITVSLMTNSRRRMTNKNVSILRIEKHVGGWILNIHLNAVPLELKAQFVKTWWELGCMSRWRFLICWSGAESLRAVLGETTAIGAKPCVASVPRSGSHEGCAHMPTTQGRSQVFQAS